jgi:hypothetical protein
MWGRQHGQAILDALCEDTPRSEGITARFGGLLHALRAQRDSTQHTREEVALHSLSRTVAAIFGPLMRVPTELPYSSEDWQSQTTLGWQEVLRIMNSPELIIRGRFQDRLDTITEEYIRRVATVWDLDDLAGAIEENTDLVAQLDDVLFAVPIAHLPVAGRPLYSCIRSIRNSFGPLLEKLQREIEAQVLEQSRDPDRLLTLSWFDTDDSARNGAIRLHEGQRELAKKHQHEWWAAAEAPRGTRERLVSWLSKERIRAATLCGHGDSIDHGLLLADNQIWRGEGRLEAAALVVIPSCSIGRARSTGLLDAEGFAVDAAANRSRSVVTCLWPISAMEAPAFANRIVDEYLTLCADPNQPHDHFRAIALNEARRQLLDSDERSQPDSPVGLNTIAAFQLQGLA